MDIVHVPLATAGQPQISAGNISFVDYSDRGSPFRNRVFFDSYAFSFVQHGQKRIYRAAGSTTLTEGYGMLIPEGNSIIAEHSDTDALYSSFIVFFPGQMGRDFLASRTLQQKPEKPEAPYIHFKTDAYIREYVRHIRSLIQMRQSLSVEIAKLKLNELLTATYELAPELLSAVFGKGTAASLQNLVEQNLLTPLSLDELAFLCNRSLSSFKRDFMQAYGLSPQKYIRERRLEMACAELAKGKLASELYLDYGYEHVANFNTAFKRKFGVTPADYRKAAGMGFSQKFLDVSQ